MDTRRVSDEKSLRTQALVILCLNFCGNVWAMLSRLDDFDEVTYKQYLKDGPSVGFDLFLAFIGGWIFFVAIIFISCGGEPSIGLLDSAATFILLDLFYIIYSVVRLSSGNGVREKYHLIVENAALQKPIEERLAYQQSKESVYSSMILLMVVLILVTLAFKFYSALVIFCYKLEVGRSHARKTRSRPESTPARQNGNSVEVNLSTPPVHRAQPSASRYPLLPSHHLTQRPSLPQQPPHHSQFPYDCSSVPLALPNRSSQAHQFPYQSPCIPLGFASQSESQPVRFPYNSATVPLSLTNSYASQPSQFPYQAPSIPINFPGRSTAQSLLRFPYDSAGIPLSLTDQNQSQSAQFPYQSSRIPFSFPGESAAQHFGHSDDPACANVPIGVPGEHLPSQNSH